MLSAAPNRAARKPAYVLEVDFGPALGRKTTSAQLTERYAAGELVGRQVAAVVNFPPKRIAGVKSEVLLLGFPDAQGHVVLVGVDHPVRTAAGCSRRESPRRWRAGSPGERAELAAQPRERQALARLDGAERQVEFARDGALRLVLEEAAPQEVALLARQLLHDRA